MILDLGSGSANPVSASFEGKNAAAAKLKNLDRRTTTGTLSVITSPTPTVMFTSGRGSKLCDTDDLLGVFELDTTDVVLEMSRERAVNKGGSAGRAGNDGNTGFGLPSKFVKGTARMEVGKRGVSTPGVSNEVATKQ